MSDDLTIVVGSAAVSGWEDISVTLRAEGFPNQFEVSFSTRDPVTKLSTVAKAGDPCIVKLGTDVVITGYIDRDIVSFGPESHTLTLIGRGKTQDLLDCSAEWDSGAITNATALDIATKLASVYGITVKLADGADAGDKVDQILVNYGETGADIIQRVARNAGLLAYEDANGVLVLATAGTKVAASGIVYGQNVQAATVENAMDERFSEVVCSQQSQDLLGDVIPLDKKANFFDTEPDPNVPRHRLMYIVMEQAEHPEAFTVKKAKWEVARRAGRATPVHATVDSWRDKDKKLWAPNTLIPVDIPGLRVPDKNLCLSEVTFRRNSEKGTTAELYLLPKAAFQPEPINLVPVNFNDVQSQTAAQ